METSPNKKTWSIIVSVTHKGTYMQADVRKTPQAQKLLIDHFSLDTPQHAWRLQMEKKNTPCCGIFLYMLYVATKLEKTWILKLLPTF